MILYRKTPALRIRRSAAPEPPFFAATTIAPYGPRRALPIAIDYGALRASSPDRLEVTVCTNVRDELERARFLGEPVLVEATELAEQVFGRGEEALDFCDEQRRAALHLISTRGALPERKHDATIVVSAWPLEFPRLESLFAQTNEWRWGVAIPVIYPVTTNLAALAQLAELARAHGATFFAPIAIELDPTAKQVIAQSNEEDDDAYTMLFHGDVEPLHTATERHIAALAHGLGMHDFIVPPRWDERSNWNGAVLLTLTASRMLAMEYEVDLASTLARSARAVAELDKPLARIAAAASLGIIDALDDVSVEVLTEWIGGEEPQFVRRVNARWRLRRDHF